MDSEGGEGWLWEFVSVSSSSKLSLDSILLSTDHE